ncbi:MAG: Ada metal-binding domain-containing protein [Microvirga sp.]
MMARAPKDLEGCSVPKQFRLIGADGQEYLSDTPGTLGGNRDGIYGRLDCPAALRALRSGNTFRRKRVFFADEATAISAGYRPCGVCMREQYKAWKGRRGV